MNSKRKRESVPFKIEVQDNDTSDEDNCFDEAFYESICLWINFCSDVYVDVKKLLQCLCRR